MNQKIAGLVLKLCSIIFLSTSCLSSDDELVPDNNEPEFIFSYNFTDGLGDWQTGFVEYPLSAEDTMNIDVELLSAPPTLNVGDSLLRISAVDPVGDLFSFIKLKVTGLPPNQEFKVLVEVEFLAVNLDTLGTTYQGDQEIHVKTGVFDREPTIVSATDTTDLGYNYNILDINKGNGVEAGADMVSIGTLIMPEPQVFTSLLRANNNGLELNKNTDANGNMWLLVGMDSETKMAQAFYYSRVAVLYDEVD